MAQSLLEWILRGKREGDAAKQATEELDKLGKKAKETGGFAKFLGDNFMVTSGDILNLAKAVPGATLELLEQGNAIAAAERALIGYTGSAEEARLVTDAVATAAGGAITKFEATQNASRLFAMGLASSADEAAKLTKMAITLGAAMGEDASTAFENFSLMLANQSIPRLDTFGISGAAVRERMAELTAETEGLDRQTAFLTATMEIGTEAMKGLDEAGFQAVNNVDRLKTTFADLKDQLATTVADGLMPIVDGAFAVKDAVDEQKASIVANSESYDDYLERLAALKEEHPILFGFTTELTEAQYEAQKATELLTEKTELLTDKNYNAIDSLEIYGEHFGNLTTDISETKSATEDLTEANDGLAFSIGKISQSKIAAEALDALADAYANNEISADDYQLATESVLTGILGFTPAEAKASTALELLIHDYEEAGGSALELYGQILALNGEIASTPRNIDIYYRFHTSGKSGADIPGTTEKDYEATQAGGQFLVTGPPGIDNIPIHILASRGEVITVTPQGLPTPGGGAGVVIDARYAQFFGIGGIQEFADQITPYIQDAMSNA